MGGAAWLAAQAVSSFHSGGGGQRLQNANPAPGEATQPFGVAEKADEIAALTDRSRGKQDLGNPHEK